MTTAQQNKILDKIAENRLKRDHLEFNTGSGCYEILKLTDDYAIFKSCKRGCSTDKHRIKIWFDKDDMDDRILTHLLKKYRRQHVYIRNELHVTASLSLREKRDKNKDIEMTKEFIGAFGKAYMSEVSEYIDSDPLYVGSIFKELEKKGLVKENV